ncbi:MAG: hypothetical protein JJT94_12490 [Bernardetiaceae bacterium]|nr:hypothetical protein [Bernardetiaceae bacterium]
MYSNHRFFSCLLLLLLLYSSLACSLSADQKQPIAQVYVSAATIKSMEIDSLCNERFLLKLDDGELLLAENLRSFGADWENESRVQITYRKQGNQTAEACNNAKIIHLKAIQKDKPIVVAGEIPTQHP